MEIKTIDIYTLQDKTLLSYGQCLSFSEAAAICLSHQGHDNEGTNLVVEGDLTAQFQLVWEDVTEQLQRSRADMFRSTEDGAYCLAMLVINELTDYRVIEQSQRRTGIDYWLGGKNNVYSFERMGLTEVSGLLNGSSGQINQRLKQKVEQSKKSDDENLPIYVVVVDFKRPSVKIVKR